MRNPIILLVLIAAALTLPPVPANAHPGVGIVVDRKGSVYYTDLENVWRIAPDGTHSIAVANVHTHELYLDVDGSLYGEHLWYEGEATDRWGYRVWKLAPDGKLVDVIPATSGFRTSYSFVRDASGAMYSARAAEGAPSSASATRIFKRAPDGSESLLAGGRSGSSDGKGEAAGFTDVRWMAVSPEGSVALIDKGSLRKIAPDGTVRTLARGLGERSPLLFWVGSKHAVMGLAVDGTGNVYVANYGSRQVKKVDGNGKVTVVARSRYPYSPTGVAVGGGGDLFVLEYAIEGVRVRKISRDGTATVL